MLTKPYMCYTITMKCMTSGKYDGYKQKKNRQTVTFTTNEPKNKNKSENRKIGKYPYTE